MIKLYYMWKSFSNGNLKLETIFANLFQIGIIKNSSDSIVNNIYLTGWICYNLRRTISIVGVKKLLKKLKKLKPDYPPKDGFAKANKNMLNQGGKILFLYKSDTRRGVVALENFSYRLAAWKNGTHLMLLVGCNRI